ncbi:MAG: LysR family transcriptional regulator [Myxococcota bacterium]
MDWRSVKFDWNRARAFLVTAEEGSLSAAARALGMTQPTLGRQVEALQQELGVVLFERSGRGLTLTPSGLELVEHVRAMGEAASRVSLAASGQSQSVEGTVCITSSEAIAAYLLPPIIAELRRTHPGIELEISASNSALDLRKREADIAIRNFRPKQPDLVSKKVRETPVWLYATPEYLEHIGNPTRPEDLSRAEFVALDRSDALLDGLNALGLSLTPANFPVMTENHLVAWELVKQGVLVGIMSEDIGDAVPGLQRALPGLPPIMVPIWLTTHREVKTSRRIRLVFDLLADALALPAPNG